MPLVVILIGVTRLTDFEWRVIEPLLPNKPRGVPRVDNRRVLHGIFWVLRSGAPWRDLPERYGPPKSDRCSRPCFSTWLYRTRNLIKRFFSKLKHFRRVATRYEKLTENLLAMVQLASMRLWLSVNETTT